MKMGEDARDTIINIIPLVLRISLEVVYVDEKNRGDNEMKNQHYDANSEDFRFSLEDGLDLHGQTLYLFLKTGHYDIIYKTEDFKEIEGVVEVDEQFNAILRQHKEDQGGSQDLLSNIEGLVEKPKEEQED